MDVTLAHVRALPEVVFKVSNVPADQAVSRSPSSVEGVRIGSRAPEFTERTRESATPLLGHQTAARSLLRRPQSGGR